MKTTEHGNKPKNIRSKNKKLIVELYRSKEMLSVSSIAQKIHLSRTTVMKINEDLLQEGIIVAAGKGSSTDEGGKKPSLYRFNAQNKLIISLHIKYDRIHFRLSDLTYKSLKKDEISIRENEVFPEIAKKMKILIERNSRPEERQSTVLACMVAIHGNVDSESGICIHSTYFPSWGTYNNLKEQLTPVLGLDCPIYLDNWIRYKAYGESKIGLAKNYDTVVLIDAGWHGVTSGILIGGKIYAGKHFLSGEIGHSLINPQETELCACGSSGCFEQQISEKRVLTRVRTLLEHYPGSTLAKEGKGLGLLSVFDAADEGDSLARIVLDEVINWFAIAISNIIMFFDPEIILIEGEYASKCRYMEKGIDKRVWELSLPRLTRQTALLFSDGQSVPTLKGAAILGVDKFYTM
ncbi:ROK family protein [Sediminispirochaeta bajacaliforniensis]|uniref:ROK family protein n=1 Tax=Sediminispirochaeta bajacaliforniensis TaxID=148 RepID=UPI00037C6F57|nr:ROK family protein [Sediminispirochaeta bajacaliforniensis]